MNNTISTCMQTPPRRLYETNIFNNWIFRLEYKAMDSRISYLRYEYMLKCVSDHKKKLFRMCSDIYSKSNWIASWTKTLKTFRIGSSIGSPVIHV